MFTLSRTRTVGRDIESSASISLWTAAGIIATLDRSQGVEDRWVDRSDAIERGSDRCQEDRRVVVVVIERNPGERPAILRRPLRQERGLPVSRWSDDRDQRDDPRSLEPSHQLCPRDETRATYGRWVEFRLGEPGAARREQGLLGNAEDPRGMSFPRRRRITDIDASIATPPRLQVRHPRFEHLPADGLAWAGRLLELSPAKRCDPPSRSVAETPRNLLRDEHGLGSIVRPGSWIDRPGRVGSVARGGVARKRTLSERAGPAAQSTRGRPCIGSLRCRKPYGRHGPGRSGHREALGTPLACD